MCLFSFVFVIGTIVSVVVFHVVSIAMSLITAASVATCLVSYAFAALKDPGVSYTRIEKELTESNSSERFCLICESVQAPGTEHCADCDLCIMGYDHHCPWTGKCIGEGNMIAFHVFIGSLLTSLILIVLSTAMSLGTLSRPNI